MNDLGKRVTIEPATGGYVLLVNYYTVDGKWTEDRYVYTSTDALFSALRDHV